MKKSTPIRQGSTKLSRRVVGKQEAMRSQKRYRFFKGLFLVSFTVTLICLVLLFILENR